MRSFLTFLAALAAVIPMSVLAQETPDPVICDAAMATRITATANALGRDWSDQRLGAIAGVRDQCMDNSDIALGFAVALFHRSNLTQLPDTQRLETLHLIWNEVLRIGTLEREVERPSELSELAKRTMAEFVSFSEAQSGSTSTFFSQPAANPQHCPPSETTIAIQLAKNFKERGGGHASGFLKALAIACDAVSADRRAPIVWYGSHIMDRADLVEAPEEKAALLDASLGAFGKYFAGETSGTTESLAQSSLTSIVRQMKDADALPDPTQPAFWEGRPELNAFRTNVVGWRIGAIWTDLTETGDARQKENRARILALHEFVKALETVTAPHGDSARAAAYEAFVRHKAGEFDKPRLTKFAKSKFVPPPAILYKPLKPEDGS